MYCHVISADDLVITSDIPLAADAIQKDGIVLSPHGEFYTIDNIRSRLSMVDTGDPLALNQVDRQAFADQLDKFLSKYKSKS